MKKTSLLISALALITAIFVMGCKQPSTPETPPAPEKSQDQIAVETAIGKLNIPKEISADEKGILLPKEVKDCAGVTVTWKSDKPAIIATNGTVTHADKAESDTVKLTAELTKGNVTATKTFKVTVKNKPLSQDEKDVRAVKDSLTINTVIEADKKIIELPVKLDNYPKVTISWVSSNLEVITNSGMITHKNDNASDVVILTAVIKCGESASDIKKFNVTVKSEKPSEQTQQDIAKLQEVAESISIADEIFYKTTKNIDLPKQINFSTQEESSEKEEIYNITWTSSNPNVINSEGTVTNNPEEEQETVTLFATLTLNKTTFTKPFPITVNNELGLQKRIEIVKEGLKVEHSKETTRTIPEDGNNISVSSDNNYEGVTVEWKSSDESVIKKNPDMVGQWIITHTPAVGDQIVTLTATITATEGSEVKKDTKVFKLTVKNPTKTLEQLKQEAITAVTEDLSMNTTVTEYQTKIELPIMIQGDLYGNANISWSSEKSNIIDAQGNVTHTTGQGDQAVKLTANITIYIKNESVPTTKVFDITVKNPAKAPEENQILTIAKDNLSIPSPTYQAGNNFGKVYLSKIQTVNNKTVSVSWALSGSDEHFEIREPDLSVDHDLNQDLYQSTSVLVLKKDIIDIPGKIKATLTYNNDTASKEINVQIPAIKNIDRYTINGNTIETSGGRYSYTDLDLQNKTINLTKTHEQRGNNNWVSIQDVKATQIEMFNDMEAKVNKVVQEPTIKNLMPVMSMMTGETVTEDDCYADLIENGCFENITYSETWTETERTNAIQLAKTSSPQEIATAISNYEMILKKQQFPMFDLSENASWKDFFDTQRAEINKPEAPVKYAYIVGEYNLQFSATYDSTKQWYKQNGSYVSGDNRLTIFMGKMGYISYNRSGNNIVVSSDGKSFTESYKDPANPEQTKTDTWTVTPSIENEKHSITVSKDQISLTLDFMGDGI